MSGQRISKHGSVRLRADWIRLVEAASRPASSEQAWFEHVFEASRDAFQFPAGVGIYAVDHPPDASSFRFRGGTADMFVDVAGAVRLLENAPPDTFRAFHFPARRVTTHGEIVPHLDEAQRAALGQYVHLIGTIDSVGIVIQPMPGTVIVMFGQVDDGLVMLDRHQRTALEQISFHLESGYRLQRLGESAVIAEISKDGAVLTGEDAPRAAELRVHRIQQAQSKRRDAEALALWPALVEGRASLVEVGKGAAKRYRVVSNPPHAWSMRGFTSREIDVLSRAAHGDSTKMIAYALGISAPVVSNVLASAAAKLGVATRTELVHLAAVLTRDPRAHVDNVDLTAAEREVLDLLKKGLGNEDIAKLRGRSVRTIANQVASLLRKTGQGNRRALAARQ